MLSIRNALLTVVAAALILNSCYKKAPTTASDYYSSREYQSRETLRQSLFGADQALLSNDDIEAILSSKIDLPRDAHMAVLRLGSEAEVLSWAFLDGSASPLSAVAESARLARVSWLPSLLVPKELTVPSLREAAARFQADLLLVYRTPCQRFQEHRLFGTDESRAYCVAEAVLLDIRTGVVPFSAFATREVEAERTPEDVNLYETVRKAEARATNEALAELADQVVEFLDATP